MAMEDQEKCNNTTQSDQMVEELMSGVKLIRGVVVVDGNQPEFKQWVHFNWTVC